MKQQNKALRAVLGALTVICVIALIVFLILRGREEKRYAQAFYGMSTLIDQKAYGSKAEQAMQEAERQLLAFEARLSLYDAQSDVAAINATAGKQAVAVQPETLALLQQAKALALQSDNAFSLTLAPLSLAWGITSETPQILTQAEIDALLPLSDDTALILDETASTAQLQQEGQAIDLGGIAKGTACNVVRDVYKQYGVKSALLSIGGNIYVHGKKPDGSRYRIGFRDPQQFTQASIASVALEDTVFAVSGGYERYFEQDGVRYHHILDPRTGRPAQSDIVSVGVIHPDGTVADFYSTTLFVWGKERALEYFQQGGCGMLLDDNQNLYVSGHLKDSFELVESGYEVHFIEE